jgi:hypothetical protein
MVAPFQNCAALRHCTRVEVTAETLYEAVAQALAMVRGHDWVGDIGTGLTTVTVKVRNPEITHIVKIQAANPAQQKPADVKADVEWHVHPSAQITETTGAQSAPGAIVFGGTDTTQTYNFVQAPSAVDIQNAGGAKLDIAVGARRQNGLPV